MDDKNYVSISLDKYDAMKEQIFDGQIEIMQIKSRINEVVSFINAKISSDKERLISFVPMEFDELNMIIEKLGGRRSDE